MLTLWPPWFSCELKITGIGKSRIYHQPIVTPACSEPHLKEQKHYLRLLFTPLFTRSTPYIPSQHKLNIQVACSQILI